MSKGRKQRDATVREAREIERKEKTSRYAGDLKLIRKGRFGPDDTDLTEVARRMVGATIVGIGFCDGAREGGFAIDFDAGDAVQRLVLGYTELGEWVEYLGRADGSSQWSPR